MTSLSETRERSRALVPGLGLAVGLLAFLTLIRLVGLSFSSVDLFFDAHGRDRRGIARQDDGTGR